MSLISRRPPGFAAGRNAVWAPIMFLPSLKATSVQFTWLFSRKACVEWRSRVSQVSIPRTNFLSLSLFPSPSLSPVSISGNKSASLLSISFSRNALDTQTRGQSPYRPAAVSGFDFQFLASECNAASKVKCEHVFELTKAGNGGVKVREFVDIFCAHPPKPRQSGRRNQQMFTTPNAQNSASAKHEGRESLFVSE